MIGVNYEADMLENARLFADWPEMAEANAGLIEFIYLLRQDKVFLEELNKLDKDSVKD